MLFLLILVPLLAALVAIPLSRPVGRAFGWLMALAPAGLGVWLCFLLDRADAGWVEGIPWVPSAGLELSLRLDSLSLSFGLLITGIGTLVVIYTASYFERDPRRGRFMAFLFLFMAAMLGVVFADNLIALFVFWEMTSIASYLLIGFDHQKERARQAALQALLTTGAGALALLAGFILLGNAAGTLRLGEIIATPGLADHPHYVSITLLIVAGAATKSAQFPFHFWLPNAMAAPTPASAYLHSATMVKAGVYLLARLSPALGGTELWFWLLVGLGSATMLAGGWLSMRQTALKPMLAYSTVIALGTLVLCVGLGTPLSIKAFTVFLFVHAFYKAALFMTAGTLIHTTHETHVEKLGGLGRVMPASALAALIAAMSMAGLPPLLGFVGKESVYEALLYAPMAGTLLVAAAVLANAANVYVAVVVGVLPFWRRQGAHPPVSGEAPFSMWIGPMVLGALGLACGLYPVLLSRHILGPGASDVMGAAMDIKLKLWHGINTALLLSIATLVLGLVAVLIRRVMQHRTPWLTRIEDLGPERGYHGAVAGMLWFSRVQTSFLQHGYLRYYLLVLITCVIAMACNVLPDEGHTPAFLLANVRAHELLIVAMIAIAAIALTRVESRFAALACLGVVGYGMALLYVFYGAPDLAKTQIIVESLSVVLFALLAAAMPGFKGLAPVSVRRRDAVLAAMAGVLMGLLVYFTLTTGQDRSVSNFYREASLPLAHGRNVVNVILVDFRALDTLGEITVLAVAAFGAQALMRRRRARKAQR
jgi:multicomponent Na+:H+ antiporter subunit A